MNPKNMYAALRYAMSFVFLWAFADKTFGLGYATTADKAWIAGGSPTNGFLLHGTHGPFAAFFQSLAGSTAIEWFFMVGLLGIGLGLLLKQYVKWAVLAGMIMMLLMYLASFPPENNPIVDEHLIYILVLAVLAIEGKRPRTGV